MLRPCSFGLPSLEEVSEFEEALGIELPSEYRRFLLEVNGGASVDPNADIRCYFSLAPHIDCSQVDDSTYEIPIHCGRELYDFWTKEEPPLDEETDEQRHVLPIGWDGSADFLVIVLTGDRRGQIMMFDHNSHGLCFLANSLAEFFQNPTL